MYKPNYIITDELITLIAQIAARVDVLTVQSGMQQNPKLRRLNRLRSIHSSLAIENNSLSLEQVTALFNGENVLAPPQDICEAQNAFEVYDRLLEFDPYDGMDLLSAHRILMKNLVQAPGEYRSGNMGVVRGNKVVHIAPPADNVSGLMADLLRWTKETSAHPLIKSCVFHYEFEIIHPFPDGNGRMGRMWQTLLLYQWKEIFAWIPVETIVHERQQEYYAAIGRSNDAGDCTEFLQFMLQAIWDTLETYAVNDNVTILSIDTQSILNRYSIDTQSPQADKIVHIISFLEVNKRVTSSEAAAFLSISTVWASKILRRMVEYGLVNKIGKNRYTYYILCDE